MTELDTDRLQQALFGAQERVRLEVQAAGTYVRMLLGLLDAARLNRFFCDRRRLRRLYQLLDPAENHYNYTNLEIGLRTGLPSERSVSRIMADAEIAPRVVQRESQRDPKLSSAAPDHSEPTDDEALRSFRYFSDLVDAELLPGFGLEPELCRIDEHSSVLQVVLDRFDLGEELFSRYTVRMSHRSKGLLRSQLRIKDERAEWSSNFRNLVSRTCAHDAELAFILLSSIEQIDVESVVRTRIGGLCFAGVQGPPVLQSLLDNHPGEFVLSLTTERASIENAADSNGDPFVQVYKDALDPQSRSLVQARQEEFGYHVRRERKFVCTPGVKPALRSLLKELDSPCVIYQLKKRAQP